MANPNAEPAKWRDRKRKLSEKFPPANHSKSTERDGVYINYVGEQKREKFLMLSKLTHFII